MNLGHNMDAVKYFASEGSFPAVFSRLSNRNISKTPYQFVRRVTNELTLEYTDLTTILSYILREKA